MKALSLLIPLAWRNLWRNKRRTWLTMLAIFIAVLSMVALGAFMRAWSRSSLDETISHLTGHGQIHNPGYLDDPSIDHRISTLEPELAHALKAPPITQYAKRVRVPALLKSERENAPIVLYGIDPSPERDLSFLAKAIIAGHYFTTDNERGIIIGEKLAQRLQTTLNRRVVVMSQGVEGSIKERGVKIIGLFHAQPELEKSTAYMTLPQTQSFLDIGNDFSEIVYRVKSDNDSTRAATQLAATTDTLQVRAWYELQPFTQAMLEMSESSILIWILLSFGVVSFGLINTLLMAVFERMREFGLLQALGMSPRWLLLQVLIESTLMVGIATLLGLVFGVIVVLRFQNGINLGIGAQYFGTAQIVYPTINWQEVSLIGVSVMLLGLLASLYPAFTAGRKVPAQILSKKNH